MMHFSIATAFFCGLVLVDAQDTPRPKIKITSVDPQPWKIPEAAPEPGDAVTIDAATLDLVITSRNAQLRVQRKLHVEPQFSLAYERSANGIRYSWSVENGRGATQPIQLFAMNAFNGPLGTTSAPPYWRFQGKSSDPGVTDITDSSLIGIWFSRFAKDVDENGRLIPGSSAGPFVLESPGLPGLITVYATGFKPDPGPGERSEESRIQDLSPWVVEQTNKLLRFPTNSKKCYIIGPKINPSADRFTSLKAEIVQVAQLPEFASVRDALTAAANSPTTATLRQALASLNGTPLQKSFFDAMIFDLSY